MILTANSEVARQTRRKTGNGWHTTFIGENRNTLREGQTPPAAGTLYPMAFLVEKEPHAVVKPHFHQADQYQVVVLALVVWAHTMWEQWRCTTPTRGPPMGRSWRRTRGSRGSRCAMPGIRVRGICRPRASSCGPLVSRTSSIARRQYSQCLRLPRVNSHGPIGCHP